MHAYALVWSFDWMDEPRAYVCMGSCILSSCIHTTPFKQLELMERRVLGLPLLSPRSVNPTAAAAAAADTAVPLPTPEGEEGSCLSPPMPPLQQEQPSPSGTNTAGSALATSSARSLATRLSRLEGSVAAMDEKIDRVLRLLAAMAAGPPGGSDMPSEGEGEEGGGSDEDGSAMNAMK